MSRVATVGPSRRTVLAAAGLPVLCWSAGAAAAARPALTPEAFGAKGDGIADDTRAMAAFFDAVRGREGMLTGVYRLTSTLRVRLADCAIRGAPGQARITGGFGYTLIIFDELSRCAFEGVTFENTHVNPKVSGAAMVYSNIGVPVREVRFSRCAFTGPRVNVAALTFFAGAGGQKGAIEDVRVEDCWLHDLGNLGVTFMNRSHDPKAARRVAFDRNRCENLGLCGTDGFAVSFDGVGEDFTCDDNLIDNCFNIGIEDTGWSRGAFRRNRFRGFRRHYAPMLFSAGRPRKLLIADNVCEEPANEIITFYGLTDCLFRDNRWRTSLIGVVSLHNANGCRFEGDHFVGVGGSAVTILDDKGPSAGNVFDGCVFDTRGGESGGAVRLVGRGTSGNIVRNSRFGAPIAMRQVNGARGNRLRGRQGGWP